VPKVPRWGKARTNPTWQEQLIQFYLSGKDGHRRDIEWFLHRADELNEKSQKYCHIRRATRLAADLARQRERKGHPR
jgi:hypothetical protein